jgi:hypothetical protein
MFWPGGITPTARHRLKLRVLGRFLVHNVLFGLDGGFRDAIPEAAQLGLFTEEISTTVVSRL